MLRTTDCRHHAVPKTILPEEEAAVIVDVVSDMLKQRGDPSRGTFVLYSQEYGESAKRIVYFDLRGGVLTYSHQKDSSDMAEEAIDGILSYPLECSCFCPAHETNGNTEMPSGIYQRGKYKAMVLNAEVSRYVCSVYADFASGGHQESTEILIGVAHAIAHLNLADRGLQEAARAPAFHMEDGDAIIYHRVYAAQEYVRGLFGSCGLPSLANWKAAQ